MQENRLWILLLGIIHSKTQIKYRCESAIYFDIDSEIIKQNCKFNFYYNKTDLTSTVLDAGNEIILANLPNNKHIICSINNNTPVRIPSYMHVLVNRSVLSNCGHRSGKNYLLESFGCMSWFKFKVGYVFYSEYSCCQLPGPNRQFNWNTWSTHIENKITFNQTLPASLNISKFDSDLLTAPRTLKDFIPQYNCKEEIFYFTERHDTTDKNLPNKNFFSNIFIVDIFLFVTAIN